MSNNRRAYRHIKSSLMQIHPKQLKGQQVRHLDTMAGMIAGIVLGKQCHLEKIASEVPEKTQVESRVKKIKRFIQNERVEAEIYYLPFIELVLAKLCGRGTITVAIDGSVTGRNCITLMISIIYRKRAIPLVWLTVAGKKGHLPESTHLTLLARLQELVPEGCRVIFLGDGEFDGIELQAEITDAGWEYVCRTAKNCLIDDDGDQFALNEVGLTPGDCIDLPNVRVTRAGYGPVLIIAWWRRGYDEPIYLVTNMECVDEACYEYRRRFRIETFFSDQKSRGFNLQRSHLSDPDRVARFLMATCLAYIWIIYLGIELRKDPALMRHLHRSDRCDYSLFQLGLRHLKYLLLHGLPLRFELVLPV